MVKNFLELNDKYFPRFRSTDYIPIADGCVMMLSAMGGTGKTYAIIRSAIKYLAENQTKSVCMWLTEDPEGLLSHRIKSIMKDECIMPDLVANRLFLKTDSPLSFAYPEKGRMVQSQKSYEVIDELSKFDYIILDPLLAFFGGSENDNSHARGFMQIFVDWALGEHKTIMLIHHSTKGNDDNPSKTRGAGAFLDACRVCYELKSNSDSQERTLFIAKDNWGANYYGFNNFKKIIKVIPDDTSRPQDTYEKPDEHRQYLISFSTDRTYDYQTSEYPFDNLADIFKSPVFYSAHGFKEGHRKGENVNTHCDLAILDIDDGYSLKDAFNLFTGYKAIIATTKSHQKEKNAIVCDRFRVIIPFKEPMKLSCDNYKMMMSEIFHTFDFVDQACKDNARTYTGYEGSEIMQTGGSEFIDGNLYLKRAKNRAKRRNELLETKYKNAPKTETQEGLLKAIQTVFDECYTTGSRNATIARLAFWLRDSHLITNEEGKDFLYSLNVSSGDPVTDGEFNTIMRGKLI